MKWHDIKDCTPREEIAENTLYYDVWANGWRIVDVKFKGGSFFLSRLLITMVIILMMRW